MKQQCNAFMLIKYISYMEVILYKDNDIVKSRKGKDENH